MARGRVVARGYVVARGDVVARGYVERKGVEWKTQLAILDFTRLARRRWSRA